MGTIGDVAKELLDMFMADARLTISIIILVATTAGLLHWLHINPALGGAILIIGSLLIVVEAVVREAVVQRGRR